MELPAKDRGRLAELLLEIEARKRGFIVLTPGGDNAAFDLVMLSPSGRFYKMQVKSAIHKEANRDRYTFTTKRGGSAATYRAYKAEEIDFLALYAFPDNEWHFVPVEKAGGHTIKIDAGGKFSQYKDNWSQFV